MVRHIVWTFVALFVAIVALIVTQRPVALDTSAVFVGCARGSDVFDIPADTHCGVAGADHGVFVNIGH